MRLLFLLCFLLGLLSGGGSIAFAQSNEATQAVPSSISTTIEQITSNVDARFAVTEVNRAQSLLADPFFTQFDGSAGLGNAVRIAQTGARNITILSQYGEQNVASLRVEGDDNVIDASQTGDGNRLGVSVLGSDNHIPVSQMGDANELFLELDGANGLRLDGLLNGGIQQVGGGIPLFIQIRPGTP